MTERKNDRLQTVYDLLTCLVGSALIGIALAVFTIPNNIAPGGVSGLSTALAFVFDIRVSVMTLLLNIPIILAAWKYLGKRSVACTLLCIVLLSLFIELAQRYLPHYTGNILIAAVYGGVVCGLGTGLLFLRGITTGGTDLVALLLRKVFQNTPNGTLLMITDCLVVVVAVIIFRDIEVALTSAITIYVSSKMIDAIAQGVDYAKVVYIITEKGSEISQRLNEVTERGNTLIDAAGGYTGDRKKMIITVTKRQMIAKTLRLIREIDPDSFVFVTDSTEVHGEGFRAD
ncbi:MAG: YitT family protein [Oscillospiraceae bacterium]|nr:YitT family protein [Oscillospiraceae bacterium]